MADDTTQVKFGANIGDLTSSMQQVQSSVKDALNAVNASLQAMTEQSRKNSQEIVTSNKQIQDSFLNLQSIQSRIMGALGQITGVLAGGAIFAGAISATEKWSGDVKGLTQIMGVSAEQASVYNVGLRLIGKTAEDFEGVVLKLTRQIKQNEEGMNALGLVTRDTQTGAFRPTMDLFQDSIQIMLQYKEGTDRNSAAMYLFGKGAKEVLDYQRLNNDVMARAQELTQKLGLTMTAEGIGKSREYKMSLAEVKLMLEGVSIAIGEWIMPLLTEFGHWILDNGTAALAAFKDGLKDWQFEIKTLQTIWNLLMLGLKDGFEVIKAIAKGLIDLWQTVKNSIAAILHGNIDEAKKIWQDGADKIAEIVDQAFAKMEQNTADFVAKEKSILYDLKDVMVDVFDPSVSGHGKPESGAGPKGGGRAWKAPDKADKGKDSGASGKSDIVSTWQTELDDIKRLYENWETWSLEREARFWADKLALTKAGSAEAQAVWRKLVDVQKQLSTQNKADLDKQAKDQEAANEVIVKEQVKHAEAVLDLKREEIRAKHELGQIDGQQMLEQLRQVDDEQYTEQLTALYKRLDIPDLELKKQAEVYAKIEELQDAHNKKMLQSQVQVAKETQKNWQQILSPIQNSLSSAITGMINKTMTFRDALKNIFQSILSEFISMCVKKLAQWIMTQFGLTTATAAGEAARAGIEKTSAAESLLTQAITGLKKIFNAAQETFAGVFANLSPYLGPLAAIPAGAASALVLATGGALNFAEKGWDVPSDSLAMLHKREMVLPRELADRVRNMTGGPGSGGDTHIHVHCNDAKSSYQWARENKEAFIRIFKDAQRNFAL